MNEEPKSIWKKPWTGLHWLRAWLIVVVATFFIVLIVTLFIPGGPRHFSDWWPVLVFMLLVSVVVATVFVGLLTFIRCFFCWRNFKRLLFGSACLATLIALFYAEEDWRGWHAWNKFKHEWEAKGEHFDFASMVPPPVPDDQNFALTPIAFTSYGFILTRDGKRIPHEQRDTNFVERIKMEIAHYAEWPPSDTGDWQKSTMSDLRVWQNYYRALAAKTNEFSVPAQPQSPADDVLLALSKYDSVIEELREASRLPCSRFPLNYDSESPAAIMLPHLAALKRCSQALQLRGIAELQNGQLEKALADVKLSLQLTDKIHTEPILISHLVRIAMVNIALQPVWEGIAAHQWSNAQLTELNAELAKPDFLADYKLTMRGEMVDQGGIIDYLRRHPEQLPNISFDGSVVKMSFMERIRWHLIPGGWYYQSRLRCARPMVELYIPLADTNRGIISPKATLHADAAVQAETRHPNRFNAIEKMLLPALGNSVKRFAYGQESLDLARVAIALERFRLAQGEYPGSLDSLEPRFIEKLPPDIINGEPLHYRRSFDGKFLLYSVGWNETDDNGQVVTTKAGAIDNSKGDWVWKY